MGRRVLIALAACAVAVAGGVTIRAQRSSATPGVAGPIDKAVLQRVVSAWASMDVARAAPFYARDSGLVFYDVAPRKYTGWTEYAKGTTEMFKGLKSLTMTVADDAQVHAASNLAWAAATVDGEMVAKDGTRTKIDARWSTVWEKRQSGWVIVHDHFSMPLPDAAPKPSRD